MNPAIEQWRARWASLAERERRMLGAGASVLALVIAYVGIYEPVAGARHQRAVALQASRALAARIEQLAAAPRSAAAPAGQGQSLLAIVDQSLKGSAIGKPPSRLQPEGETTVRLWLEDVPFESLVRWLNELQERYGVRVDNAEVERESGPGLVSARLTLARG